MLIAAPFRNPFQVYSRPLAGESVDTGYPYNPRCASLGWGKVGIFEKGGES